MYHRSPNDVLWSLIGYNPAGKFKKKHLKWLVALLTRVARRVGKNPRPQALAEALQLHGKFGRMFIENASHGGYMVSCRVCRLTKKGEKKVMTTLNGNTGNYSTFLYFLA